MPPTKHKQLRTRKKERTRNTIIAEATKLFNEKPYEEVLLEDIAEASFISRQTLYNYFKNKEDVHYAVGNQVYKEENMEFAKIVSSDKTGKEQLLDICARIFEASKEKPILLKVVRDFWKNFINRSDSSAQIYSNIETTIGKEKMNELIEKPGKIEEYDFENHFDEPNFIEEYIQFIRHNYLWQIAIEKGKKDGTIKINLPNMQIMQFINIVTSGTIHEIMRRQSALDRINMTQEDFSVNIIKLMSHFLDDYPE
jgi:AcrR family transcriptional regulator